MGRGMWKHLPQVHVTIGPRIGMGRAARSFDVAPGAHAYCVVLTVRSRNTAPQALTHPQHADSQYTHMSTLPIVHVAEHLSLQL